MKGKKHTAEVTGVRIVGNGAYRVTELAPRVEARPLDPVRILLQDRSQDPWTVKRMRTRSRLHAVVAGAVLGPFLMWALRHPLMQLLQQLLGEGFRLEHAFYYGFFGPMIFGLIVFLFTRRWFYRRLEKRDAVRALVQHYQSEAQFARTVIVFHNLLKDREMEGLGSLDLTRPIVQMRQSIATIVHDPLEDFFADIKRLQELLEAWARPDCAHPSELWADILALMTRLDVKKARISAVARCIAIKRLLPRKFKDEAEELRVLSDLRDEIRKLIPIKQQLTFNQCTFENCTIEDDGSVGELPPGLRRVSAAND